MPGDAPTLVFGLTGGVGSGKSTVAARFGERGVPVVDADELARQAVAKGSAGLREVVEALGADLLREDGELDRARLAQRVFDDAAARARLEGILHPRIRTLAEARFSELAGLGEALICYEIPLLFETGQQDRFRPVVVVTAREELQRTRAAARIGESEERVKARLRAQLPLLKKAAGADHVIDNSGTIAQTRDAADRVLDAICQSAGVDPSQYPA